MCFRSSEAPLQDTTCAPTAIMGQFGSITTRALTKGPVLMPQSSLLRHQAIPTLAPLLPLARLLGKHKRAPSGRRTAGHSWTVDNLNPAAGREVKPRWEMRAGGCARLGTHHVRRGVVSGAGAGRGARLGVMPAAESLARRRRWSDGRGFGYKYRREGGTQSDGLW
jgi:hypothetical protein